MAGRRLPLLAVFLATAAGALALGLSLQGKASARSQGPAGVVSQGQFRSIGWGTNGTATVVRDRGGRLTLRFDPAFTTQHAPELFVYVGRFHQGRSTAGWTLVGSLRSARGAQSYRLHHVPASDASVTIFCAKCDRIWGTARLVPRTES